MADGISEENEVDSSLSSTLEVGTVEIDSAAVEVSSAEDSSVVLNSEAEEVASADDSGAAVDSSGAVVDSSALDSKIALDS